MLAPSNRESGAGQGSAVWDGTVVRYRVRHDVVKRALCNKALTPQLTGCCALDSIHTVLSRVQTQRYKTAQYM